VLSEIFLFYSTLSRTPLIFTIFSVYGACNFPTIFGSNGSSSYSIFENNIAELQTSSISISFSFLSQLFVSNESVFFSNCAQ